MSQVRGVLIISTGFGFWGLPDRLSSYSKASQLQCFLWVQATPEWVQVTPDVHGLGLG